MNLLRKSTLLLALVLVPAAASAGGSVLDGTTLPSDVRARYSSEIAAARAATPATFRAVANIVQRVPELERSKRGRVAPVVRYLQGLGQEAFWPMMEAAAFDGPSGDDWQPTALAAWQSALLEALGQLQDVRAIPLFDAVLTAAPATFNVLRSAVVARGLFGDDAGLERLVSMARTTGSHQDAVLAGLGRCRRVKAAETLAAALDVAAPSSQRARDTIEALADIGSSWVWPTLPVAQQSEGTTVRIIAAEALVRAFVRLSGEERDDASNALMVVDCPETPMLIAAAEARADGDTRLALSKLAARFARNPTR